MVNKSSNYRISFTSGGLYYRDATKVAGLYLNLRDWSAVKNAIQANNLIQSRTQSSLTRTSHELLQRLQVLSEGQTQLLVAGTRQEQNQILWLAVCKHYLFVRDFAREVVREKYLRLDWELSPVDFDIFFNNKAEWHAELEKATDSTRKKLRQVLFRMLTEAEIISPINLILPVMFSNQVAKAILDDDPEYFSVFPISEIDIRKYVP